MNSRRMLLIGGALGAAGLGGYVLGGGFSSEPVPAAVPDAQALSNEVELTPEAARNFGLTTAPAEMRPLTRTIRATGTIGYNELRLAHITPLARGRVQAVETAVGEHVSAGQRLMVLDALELAEARYNLATAEAGRRQAEAEASTARAALQRATDLVRGGSMAPSEVERRRADLARAEAAIQTRSVEAAHWREMLGRYVPTGVARPGPETVSIPGASPLDALGAIVAPFDGTVMSIGATPGEMVEPGREIISLADLSLLWVQAEVPERELAVLRADAKVLVTAPAFPGRVFEGRLSRIADEINARTGTVRVRCELPNPEGMLRVNMFVTVEIEAPLGREGVVIPDGAVQSVDDKAVVFVALGERRFSRRDVTIAQRQRGWAEVTAGLQPGEVVAVQASFRLKSMLLRARAGDEG